MSFIAILVALLLEQARPLPRGNPIHAGMRAWVRMVARAVDAGQPQQAWLAWAASVLVPSLFALALHWLLVVTLGWAAAVVWNIAVLYATLGFRQFSHHFTEIRDALEGADEARARQLLADWQQSDASGLPRSEIVRQVVEHSVIAAHRHVFGVLVWFSVLAAFGFGPAGAVLYRLGEFAPRYWMHKDRSMSQPVSSALQDAATRAWQLLDWLPARITAIAFAVVGSFEAAIEGWHDYEQRGPGDSDGVILAATAGAVGLRIGPAASMAPAGAGAGDADDTQPDGPATPMGLVPPGQTPEVGHMRIIVGLVWRTVVMWMVLLALLTLARLLG